MLEHPPKFQGKIRHTKKDLLLVTKFSKVTTGYACKDCFYAFYKLGNAPKSVLAGALPGPHWGSLQRSLRPLAGGEGARRILPKNPTLLGPSGFGHTGYAVSSSNTLRK